MGDEPNELYHFVGLGVHKKIVSVAVAEGGRGGEVRRLGTFESRVAVLKEDG